MGVCVDVSRVGGIVVGAAAGSVPLETPWYMFYGYQHLYAGLLRIPARSRARTHPVRVVEGVHQTYSAPWLTYAVGDADIPNPCPNPDPHPTHSTIDLHSVCPAVSHTVCDSHIAE